MPIRVIYLHAGVQKTASTSIQKILCHHRDVLKSAGYLYPVFKVGGLLIDNHSIPLRSLSSGNPAAYHMNIKMGYTEQEQINNLHTSYIKQMAEQLSGFEGENLIISGEDISLLQLEKLIRLKHFLSDMSGKNVMIKVVLFCRNPLTWIKSFFQEDLKHGNTVFQSLRLYHAKKEQRNYRNIVNRFSKVFSENNIEMIRFEDAVKHPQGPAGTLLSHINAPNKLVKQIDNRVFNQTLSYEAIQLLNAINKKYPIIINGRKNKARSGLRENDIRSIPGTTCKIPDELCKKIWFDYHDDINWLCNTFSLPFYQYREEEDFEYKEAWSSESLAIVKKLLPKQPAEFRKIIIDTIEKETENDRLNLSAGRKSEVLKFSANNRSFWTIALQSVHYYVRKTLKQIVSEKEYVRHS